MPVPKKIPLNGKTRLVAILGWPLTYTLSPAFQNAAVAAAGIDAAYLALATKDPAAFKALAKGLMASSHFVGANITNPYKTEALRLADKASPAAKAIGAANTLVRQGVGWVAHNTDAPGFLAAARQAGARVKGARVLILGGGGVARAVAWASSSAGAAEVAVLARRVSQARDCAKVAKNKGFGAILSEKNIGLASQAATWVVNTLPGAALGGEVAAQLVPAEAGRWAMDVSYLPRPLTPFLVKTKKLGYHPLDGLPMLMEQGRLSFQLWFGKNASRGAMTAALKAELF
jgi:shikimate dehydrogenase